MSAAQNETAEQRAERLLQRREKMKKVRKAREVKRRHVVTLPDDLSWYMNTHCLNGKHETVPALIRLLTIQAIDEGLLPGVNNLNEIRIAYKKHLRDAIDLEIEVLAASDDQIGYDGA